MNQRYFMFSYTVKTKLSHYESDRRKQEKNDCAEAVRRTICYIDQKGWTKLKGTETIFMCVSNNNFMTNESCKKYIIKVLSEELSPLEKELQYVDILIAVHLGGPLVGEPLEFKFNQ